MSTHVRSSMYASLSGLAVKQLKDYTKISVSLAITKFDVRLHLECIRPF